MLQHRLPHRQPHGVRCAPTPACETLKSFHGACCLSAHVTLRIQRNRLFAAALDVDLVDWPEGTKPKRGRLTKAALKRLKVPDLQQELRRRNIEAVADSKDVLLERLWAVLEQQASSSSDSSHPSVDAPSSSRTPDPHTTTAATTIPTTHNLGSDASASHSTIQPPPPPAAAAAAAAAGWAQPVPDPDRVTQSYVRHTLPNGSPVWLPRELPLAAAQALCEAAAGVPLEGLPPFPPGRLGRLYDMAHLGLSSEEEFAVLANNRTGLALTFLGTGGVLSGAGGRCAPGLALNRVKDVWLVDAGEDVQRQMMWVEHLRPSKFSRLFVTSMSPRSVLGLPGLLCCVSAARAKGHEIADIPIHVYGPAGLAQYLARVFELSRTFLEMPVVVHEFVLGPVSEEEQQPVLYNYRAKLWRALLPPDQYNPQGYTDGDLTSFMPTQGRASVMKGSRASGGVLGSDPRAGYHPHRLPPPGDAAPATRLPLEELTWSIRADEATMVTAALVGGIPAASAVASSASNGGGNGRASSSSSSSQLRPGNSGAMDSEEEGVEEEEEAQRRQAAGLVWGLLLVENDRQGNLNVERCNALGVPPGSAYNDLKVGAPVVNTAGVEVPNVLAVAPARPGRTLLLLPSLQHPQALLAAAASAGPLDVVVADVHEAYSRLPTGTGPPAAAGGGGGAAARERMQGTTSSSHAPAAGPSASRDEGEAGATGEVVQLLQPIWQAAAAGWPVRNLVLQGCVGVPQRREFGIMARAAQRSAASDLRQPIESPSTTGDDEEGLDGPAVQSRVNNSAGLTGRLAAAVEALAEGELVEALSKRYAGPAILAEDGMTLVLEEHRGLEPAALLDAEGYAELAEVKRQTELLTVLNKPSTGERQQQRERALREQRGGYGGGGARDRGGRGGSGGRGGRQQRGRGRGGGGRGGSMHANGGRGFRGGTGSRDGGNGWQGASSWRPPAEVGQ